MFAISESKYDFPKKADGCYEVRYRRSKSVLRIYEDFIYIRRDNSSLAFYIADLGQAGHEFALTPATT